MTPVPPPDAETISWLRISLACTVVIAMLALLAFGLKLITQRGLRLPGRLSKPKRIQLVETLALDPRRRLVILRCDNKEHLLLLGLNRDIVVASNLEPGTTPLHQSPHHLTKSAK